VTPNEPEATTITGIHVVDSASARHAGKWFLERGVTAALITLGSKGAILVTSDGDLCFDAIPVAAVDTAAAGDTFAGYLGEGWLRGILLKKLFARPWLRVP
jgi:ribokinase